MKEKTIKSRGGVFFPGEEVNIFLVRNNPLTPHIALTIYAQRFWRPVLGGLAFDLWLILRDYALEAEVTKEEASIAKIAATLAYGDRHTILGRGANGPNPARPGLIHSLIASGVVEHTKTGEGTATKHHFGVLEDLPLLTNDQIKQLSPEKRLEHEMFLRRYQRNDPLMSSFFSK